MIHFLSLSGLLLNVTLGGIPQSQFLHSVFDAAISASWQEQLATVLSIVGVWLAIKQSLWNFPIGLIAVILTGIAFFQAQLYAQEILQAFYFIALCYGWWRWAHPDENQAILPVTMLNNLQRFGYLVAGVVGMFLWGWYLRNFTDASFPFGDALVASFGLVSQWLEAHKKIETWSGWLIVNAAATVICALAGLYWLTFLSIFLFGLALHGQVEWLKSHRTEMAK